MFQALKKLHRRRQLTRRQIVPQLSIETLTAGARSGVWTVWPALLHTESVIYSFGVGDNIAWELALIDRFGLTVHAFDPTPASVDWVARQNLPSNFVFHPIGVAGHDGMLPFTLPRRGSRFNYRPSRLPPTHGSRVVEAPVRRLATLMQQLGHERLDVLKIDVEGGEYDVIDDLLRCQIPVGQLLVEFHHHFPGVGIERTREVVTALHAHGYQIFHISDRGLEIGFLRESHVDLAEPGRSVR